MATLDDADRSRDLDGGRAVAADKAGDLTKALEQIQSSLDAAAAVVESDVNAALDDIMAARLVVGTLLLKLRGSHDPR